MLGLIPEILGMKQLTMKRAYYLNKLNLKMSKVQIKNFKYTDFTKNYSKFKNLRLNMVRK